MPQHDPPSRDPGAAAERADTLHELGEREFIRSVVEAGDATPRDDAGVLVCFGDDAAVFQPEGGGPRQIVTTDAMAEETHFRRTTPPEVVGWRLAVANASDIAAMGGAPTVAVVTVAAPATTPVSWLRGLYGGMRRAATELGFRLVGGDTIRAERIVLTLTMLGRIEDGVALPLRANARPGDTLYVTGWPGESGAGFHLAEAPGLAGRIGRDVADRLIARHQHPTPRLKAGQAIARSFERVAMIDVSDGVFNETSLVCEASGGLGAVLEVARFPIRDDLRTFAARAETTAVRQFLYGGEDFELLFACDATPQEVRAILRADDVGVDVTPIGQIRSRPGIVVLGADGGPLPEDPDVFSHF